MGTLSNPRHERFAQELAKGKTADEAYQLAGYTENRHNASRLKTNETVSNRIAELQQKAADKAEVTVESLIGEADDFARLARSTKQLSAGVAAVTLKAKLAGLLVDRKEQGAPGEFERLNADERRQLRDALERELEGRSGDAGQAGQAEPAGGIPPLH